MNNDNNRSVPDLLGDLVNQTSTLVRKEIQLARAEMGEKMSTAGSAAIGIGAGAVLFLGALVILLQAAVAALVEYGGLSATAASLIVAAVVMLVGYLLLRGGLNKLKASSLTPDRTVTQLSRDAQVVKEQVR